MFSSVEHRRSRSRRHRLGSWWLRCSYQSSSAWPQGSVNIVIILTLSGDVRSVKLSATVSVEVCLKRKLLVTSVDCCDRRFVNLCALFAIMKVISYVCFTNK